MRPVKRSFTCWGTPGPQPSSSPTQAISTCIFVARSNSFPTSRSSIQSRQNTKPQSFLSKQFSEPSISLSRDTSITMDMQQRRSECSPGACQFNSWVRSSADRIWLGDRTKIKLRINKDVYCWYELVQKTPNVMLPLLGPPRHSLDHKKILCCPFCGTEIGVMDRVKFDLNMSSVGATISASDEFVRQPCKL